MDVRHVMRWNGVTAERIDLEAGIVGMLNSDLQGLAIRRVAETDVAQRASGRGGRSRRAAAAGLHPAASPLQSSPQLPRISNLPSVVSAIARTDVQRSIRTRIPISATRAPPAKSKVETTGDGLLSMITRSCLMCPIAPSPKRTVNGVADGSGVLAGASRLMKA